VCLQSSHSKMANLGSDILFESSTYYCLELNEPYADNSSL
jgi:hypothetical protein